MLVYKVEIEAYRIGDKTFVVNPTDGYMHEITTGRSGTDEEWAAYREFCEEEFRKKKLQEEYDRIIKVVNERHEVTKSQIHRAIFGG